MTDSNFLESVGGQQELSGEGSVSDVTDAIITNGEVSENMNNVSSAGTDCGANSDDIQTSEEQDLQAQNVSGNELELATGSQTEGCKQTEQAEQTDTNVERESTVDPGATQAVNGSTGGEISGKVEVNSIEEETNAEPEEVNIATQGTDEKDTGTVESSTEGEGIDSELVEVSTGEDVVNEGEKNNTLEPTGAFEADATNAGRGDQLNTESEELDTVTEGNSECKTDLDKETNMKEQACEGKDVNPEDVSSDQANGERQAAVSEQKEATGGEYSEGERKRSVTVGDPRDLGEVSAKSGQPAVGDDNTSNEEASSHRRSRTFGPGNEAPTGVSGNEAPTGVSGNEAPTGVSGNEAPTGVSGNEAPTGQDAHDLQSKTVWYVDEEETPDTVSYSTTIVGGVIHRVPIESSPKTQPKSPRNATQQSQGILRNLTSFFGKRKKSKSGPVQSSNEQAGNSTQASDDKGTTVPVNVSDSTQFTDDKRMTETHSVEVVSEVEEDEEMHTSAAQDGADCVLEENEGADNHMSKAAVSEQISDELSTEETKKEASTLDSDLPVQKQDTEEVVDDVGKAAIPQHDGIKTTEHSEELMETIVVTKVVSAEKESSPGTEIDGKKAPKSEETNKEADGGEASIQQGGQVQQEHVHVEHVQPVESQLEVSNKMHLEQTLPNGAMEPGKTTAEGNTNVEGHNVPSDSAGKEPSSPEPANDEDSQLRQHIVKKQRDGSYSPKTQRMQMRVSYAERTPQGDLEVEVISTPEIVVHRPKTNNKSPVDHHISCRELGEADHEGWLTKKGGNILFASWKRKWVVLKDQHLYYYKTSFDIEAGGVIPLEGCLVAAAPEVKKKFCFTCEQPGVKAGKLFFAGDTKEEMDKWLNVLSLAIRGESIIKAPSALKVDHTHGMRKKSSSISKTKRTESVLGLGGQYDDFYNDKEDCEKLYKRNSVSESANKEGSSSGKEARSAEQNHDIMEHGVPSGKDGVATDQKSESKLVMAIVDTESMAIKEVAAASTDGVELGESSSHEEQVVPIKLQLEADCESSPPVVNGESIKPLKELAAAVVDSGAQDTETKTCAVDACSVPQPNKGAPSLDKAMPPIGASPNPTSDIVTSQLSEEAPLEGVAVPENISDDTIPQDSKEVTSGVNSAPQPSGEVSFVDETTAQTCAGACQLSEEALDNIVPTSSEMTPSEDGATPQLSEEAADDTVSPSSDKTPSEDGATPQLSKEAADDTVSPSSDKTPSEDGASPQLSEEAPGDTVSPSSDKTHGFTPPPSKEAPSRDETISQKSLEVPAVNGTTAQLSKEASSVKVTALPGEDGPSLDVGTDDEKTQPNEEAPADDAESKPSIGITSANVTTNKSPTSTTWYCVLDMEKDVWSLPDGNEKAVDTQDKCRSSSGTLDSEEDPMTEVYMKLNSARLSIVGRPLLNTQDRLRAMSSANKEQKVSQTILKLRALERSLKDKQKDVSSCDDLLSKDVNRMSLGEWIVQNPHLSLELEGMMEEEEDAQDSATVQEKNVFAEDDKVMDTHL